MSAPSFADEAATGSIDISITSARSTRGNMLVCITPDATRFPNCRGDARARTLTIPASAPHAHITGLAPGTWAIAVVHDENGNGRMDTMLGMPREGVGASRNPAMRMGPPRFADAAFAVGSAPVSQSVRLRYIL